MKIHVTDNKKLAEMIRQGLKDNDGYCPCIYQSKGKPEYKCLCKDFRENVLPGMSCHCGLYIKDSDSII